MTREKTARPSESDCERTCAAGVRQRGRPTAARLNEDLLLPEGDAGDGGECGVGGSSGGGSRCGRGEPLRAQVLDEDDRLAVLVVEQQAAAPRKDGPELVQQPHRQPGEEA